MGKKKNILLIFCALGWVVSFLFANFFSSTVDSEDIHPLVLRDPIQTPLQKQPHFNKVNGEYEYKITPIHSYDIAGIVTANSSHDQFWKPTVVSSIFASDLCMIWGKTNIKSMGTSNFKHKYRWCHFWFKDDFDLTQISNSHLLYKNERTKKLVQSLKYGDQVRIQGQLVNVDKNKGETPYPFSWQTSTVREDTGGGACENIYVEKVTILKRHNVYANFGMDLSIAGIFISFLVGTAQSMRSISNQRTRKIDTGYNSESSYETYK